MLFAITDIETTGGHASGNGITEVAVFVHDGQQVVDSFHTLINPGQPIPFFIQKLTGITDEMVQLAPRFEEVASRVYELLQDKVFVAHNVNFDYSFLHHQLQHVGYHLTSKKLCTVRYSRKLFPQLSSYSLGNLCRHFGIPVFNRHRAAGDARATVQLFELLRKKDVNNHLYTMLRKQSKEQLLPLYLDRSDVDRLPLTPGVYYFHDVKGKIIYVGKAVQLKKRVLSHFSGNTPSRQRQEFLRNIHRISYQQCGTELMASILETIEIKRLWPRYNKAVKGYEASFGLYTYEDAKGYLRLGVDKKHRHLPAVKLYYNRWEAIAELRKVAEEFSLCLKLCFIDQSKDTCCGATHCMGACSQEESAVSYNRRVKDALQRLQEELPSFAIRERSWFNDSYSYVLMDEGRFYGMGYLSADEKVAAKDALRERLQEYPENDFVRNLVKRYALLQPENVIWFQ